MPPDQPLPLTAEQQALLTPDTVLEQLLAGNGRYVRDQLTPRMLVARRNASQAGAYPKAVILTCLDSRIPVEIIFDQSIGDLFVGRNAGNVANEDQLGSMEFATAVAGARLVMVMGHSDCKLIQAACDKAAFGHLDHLFDQVEPALEAVTDFAPTERTSANLEFVAAVGRANVEYQVDHIRRESPVLKKLEGEGRIHIVGAHYSLASGEVTLL